MCYSYSVIKCLYSIEFTWAWFFFLGRGAKPLGLDLSKVHGAYLHDSILAKEMNSNQLKASLGWVIIYTNYMNFSFWCLACIDALHIFTSSQISLLLSIIKIMRRRILIFLLIPIAIFSPKKRSQLKHRLTLERERALLRIKVKIKPRKN